jgi:N utilization substance protein B
VELVFESFQRGVALGELARRRLAGEGEGAAPVDDAAPLPAYAARLALGVAERQTLISEWLDTYSQGWPQPRMPAVDRAILYVGAYEVVFEDDVPDRSAISGAADLAGRLSTDKSANFVSGLLGRLSEIKATLV